MEYKNRCGCPRDMVDNELIETILGEGTTTCGNYGRCARGQRRMARQERPEPERPGCGCGNRPRPEPRPICGWNDEDGRGNDYTTVENSHYGCRNEREVGNGNRGDGDCGRCARENDPLANSPLAMAYTPDQEWRELFCEEEALGHGTLFRELDFPFYPACKSCR